ncbi:hypothetical protein L1987_20628 [Smallanthus sonchifolius]|uniref:Uncharacterized protein n=1 Tax=Smallanthus sonchifolius TaxID=185202 RepID=A0ACB9ITE8_9ASTR|nr:hypothetical protein L1987_20628 [Smallanthus sonchifolius]
MLATPQYAPTITHPCGLEWHADGEGGLVAVAGPPRPLGAVVAVGDPDVVVAAKSGPDCLQISSPPLETS